MIVLVSQCYPPQVGGIETLMADLASQLSQNTLLTVLTKAHPESTNFDPQQPYPVQRFQGNKWIRRFKLRKALKAIHADKPVTHVLTDSWKSAKTILPMAKHLNIPVHCLAHGNDVLTKNKFWRRRYIQQTLAQCTNVIAVSHATQDIVKSLNITHSQVIHNGVDDQAYQGQVKPLNTTSPQLLTLARLEPRKGQDQVLKAIAILKKQWPNIHYHIAGSGCDLPRLQQYVHDLKLADHVTFHGRVSQAEKIALLKRADFFIMPVRYDVSHHSIEGLGISLIEAQLMGLPVITGQVGGVTEVIQHASTGLCCDGTSSDAVANAIACLLDDPKQAKKLAQNGQRHAQAHFTHSVMLKRYKNLLSLN